MDNLKLNEGQNFIVNGQIVLTNYILNDETQSQQQYSEPLFFRLHGSSDY
jgi:hypothetical protein